MRTFVARLAVMSAAQRALWDSLGTLPRQFVLYGGTGVALRLGHRPSYDLDFFSSESLQERALIQALPQLASARVIQRTPDTLSLLAPAQGAEVKLSFFCDIDFGRIGEPEQTDDTGVSVASLTDLLATKLKVLLERIEAKDYLDVAAILATGIQLAEGLGGAQALFGTRFPVAESVKALTYFHGGDLDTLPANVKNQLRQSTQTVPASIPPLPRASDNLHVPL